MHTTIPGPQWGHLRREAASAAALAHFQFASTVPKLVEACRIEVARTSAGATGALKALEE